jgi:hypothetical protein
MAPARTSPGQALKQQLPSGSRGARKGLRAPPFFVAPGLFRSIVVSYSSRGDGAVATAAEVGEQPGPSSSTDQLSSGPRRDWYDATPGSGIGRPGCRARRRRGLPQPQAHLRCRLGPGGGLEVGQASGCIRPAGSRRSGTQGRSAAHQRRDAGHGRSCCSSAGMRMLRRAAPQRGCRPSAIRRAPVRLS